MFSAVHSIEGAMGFFGVYSILMVVGSTRLPAGVVKEGKATSTICGTLVSAHSLARLAAVISASVTGQ